MLRRFLVLTLSIGILFSLAACSSPSAAGQQPVEVKVTAGEYYFKSSMTTFQQGVTYHFVVTNEGSMEHEFMIVKPMPTTSSMDDMDKQALAHIEEEDLQPGQTATVEYTFTKAYPAGTMEFACHLPGHYEQGMHLGIEVK